MARWARCGGERASLHTCWVLDRPVSSHARWHQLHREPQGAVIFSEVAMCSAAPRLNPLREVAANRSSYAPPHPTQPHPTHRMPPVCMAGGSSRRTRSMPRPTATCCSWTATACRRSAPRACTTTRSTRSTAPCSGQSCGGCRCASCAATEHATSCPLLSVPTIRQRLAGQAGGGAPLVPHTLPGLQVAAAAATAAAAAGTISHIACPSRLPWSHVATPGAATPTCSGSWACPASGASGRPRAACSCGISAATGWRWSGRYGSMPTNAGPTSWHVRGNRPQSSIWRGGT